MSEPSPAAIRAAEDLNRQFAIYCVPSHPSDCEPDSPDVADLAAIIERETGIGEAERKRILSELETLESMADIEMAHAMADDQLRELLITLGFSDVVEAYDEVPKWFA